MRREALAVEIQPERDGAIVYKLRGSLDLETAPSLRAALTQAADEGKNDIIVDLTQLEFLDSTGLGALIGAHRRALEHGGRLRLIVAPGTIERLLNITGLIDVFAAYGTVESALHDQDRLIAAL